MNEVRTAYSYRTLFGTGSTTNTSSSGSDTQALINDVVPGTSDTSNTFGNVLVYIPNYAGATSKTFSLDGVGENNATSATQAIAAGAVTATAAITKMTFFMATGAWALNSTASIYGITKGSDGIVTTS